MTKFNLASALAQAKPGRVRLFSLPSIPTTARELIQRVFTIIVGIDAAASLFQLYRFNALDAALWFLLAAYGGTLLFALTHGVYAVDTKGEIDPDCLNGRTVGTGRNVLRTLWLICAAMLLGWALKFAPTFEFLYFGPPLLGMFLTVIAMGCTNRLYCAAVRLPADQGIKS
jgi:hypothetical protein